MNRLEEEYDYVCIIDMLSPEQSKDYPVADRLQKYLAIHDVHTKIVKTSCRQRLLNFLGFLKNKCSSKKVIIHFICHGYKEGICAYNIHTNNMDDIEWDELREDLYQISKNMDGTLIIFFSSCNGLHGIKIVDTDRKNALPFFGILGSNRKVVFEEMRLIGEQFYKGLFDEKDINQIVREINKCKGEEVFYNITGDGYSELST